MSKGAIKMWVNHRMSHTSKTAPPRQILSEDAYVATTEDPIRTAPLVDMDETWTVVKRKKHRVLNLSEPIPAEVQQTVEEAELRKREKKQLKMTRKQQIRSVVNINKKRWMKGEPDIMGQEYTAQLQTSLATFFRSGYEHYFNDSATPAIDDKIIDFVNRVIIKYKLLISGGYILKNMGLSAEDMSKPSVDIDIYVPHSTPDKYPEFYSIMAKLFDCDQVINKHGDKVNDVAAFIARGKDSGKHSFFKQNGIYSVFKHSRNVNGVYAEMDLVRAADGKKPVNIIRNFDLTVCMNWYDGEHINAMDSAAIFKEGTGHLNYSYVPLLLGIKNERGALHEPNGTTRDRVLKYILRGYRVSYVDPRSGETVEIVAGDLLNAVERLPPNKRNKYYNTYPHHRPAHRPPLTAVAAVSSKSPISSNRTVKKH